MRRMIDNVVAAVLVRPQIQSRAAVVVVVVESISALRLTCARHLVRRCALICRPTVTRARACSGNSSSLINANLRALHSRCGSSSAGKCCSIPKRPAEDLVLLVSHPPIQIPVRLFVVVDQLRACQRARQRSLKNRQEHIKVGQLS